MLPTYIFGISDLEICVPRGTSLTICNEIYNFPVIDVFFEHMVRLRHNKQHFARSILWVHYR